MEYSFSSSAIVVLVACSSILYLVKRYLELEHDPKEPPLMPQKIPYIGHVLGLIQHGLRYYTKLNARRKLPIYTLQTLNTKTYVINSPDLAIAVQRNAKTLSFSPFVLAMVPRFFDVGDDVTSILKRNMHGEDGDWGPVYDMHHANYWTVAPGPILDGMVRSFCNSLIDFMDELGTRSRSDEEITVDLFAWTKHSFGRSTTDAAYGPENPYKLQPELENDFWDFEAGLKLLLLGIAPWLVARKAHQARQRIFDGMNSYFARNWRQGASELVKARHDALISNGLSTDIVARFELGDSIGIMVNATPSAFWILNYVYMNPALLEDLRREISAGLITTTNQETGIKQNVIDVKNLRDNCPLLVSTFQEVLRLQTENVQSRWVVKDTLINDQYLLRKDSVVQMPGAIIHQDPAIWGPDVNSFNPRRFLKGETKHSPGAFRSFGGGATLCPGRHFALAEIISFAAMFMMRFELIPVNGGWRKPSLAGKRIVSSIPGPSSDISVYVEPRKGYESDGWAFTLTG